MAVALLVVGGDGASDHDGDLDVDVDRVRRAVVMVPENSAKRALDLAHQVADAEADLGVRGVDGPGAGDEAGGRDLLGHEESPWRIKLTFQLQGSHLAHLVETSTTLIG